MKIYRTNPVHTYVFHFIYFEWETVCVCVSQFIPYAILFHRIPKTYSNMEHSDRWSHSKKVFKNLLNYERRICHTYATASRKHISFHIHICLWRTHLYNPMSRACVLYVLVNGCLCMYTVCVHFACRPFRFAVFTLNLCSPNILYFTIYPMDINLTSQIQCLGNCIRSLCASSNVRHLFCYAVQSTIPENYIIIITSLLEYTRFIHRRPNCIWP